MNTFKRIFESRGYNMASEIKKLVNKTGQKVNLSDKNVTAIILKGVDKEVMNTLTDAGFKSVPANGGTAFYKLDENLSESVSIDDMIEEIGELDGKGAQVAWDWFEDNLGDSGIYAGDAVPEDYLEIMTDKQIKELYKKVKRYI